MYHVVRSCWVMVHARRTWERRESEATQVCVPYVNNNWSQEQVFPCRRCCTRSIAKSGHQLVTSRESQPHRRLTLLCTALLGLASTVRRPIWVVVVVHDCTRRRRTVRPRPPPIWIGEPRSPEPGIGGGGPAAPRATTGRPGPGAGRRAPRAPHADVTETTRAGTWRAHVSGTILARLWAWRRTPLRPHARPGQDRCWGPGPVRPCCCGLPRVASRCRRPSPRCMLSPARPDGGGQRSPREERGKSTLGSAARGVGPWVG